MFTKGYYHINSKYGYFKKFTGRGVYQTAYDCGDYVVKFPTNQLFTTFDEIENYNKKYYVLNKYDFYEPTYCIGYLTFNEYIVPVYTQNKIFLLPPTKDSIEFAKYYKPILDSILVGFKCIEELFLQNFHLYYYNGEIVIFDFHEGNQGIDKNGKFKFIDLIFTDDKNDIDRIFNRNITRIYGFKGEIQKQIKEIVGSPESLGCSSKQ